MPATELSNSVLVNSSSLKAYYRFLSGGLTTDSSGNSKTLSNNGTVTEGTGLFGGSADLGSSNTTKYLSISDRLSWNKNNFSISLWIKMNQEIGVSGYWILSEIQEAATDSGLSIAYNYNSGTRSLDFSYIAVGVAGTEIKYNITLGTTDWHHLVITYDGSNLSGFCDGISIGSVAASGSGSTGQDVFWIGGRGGSFLPSCQFDDVSVFQKTLSADEVKELYEGRTIGELWPQSNLQGLWHFNGGPTDYSGNKYNLTTSGSPTYPSGKFGKAIDLESSSSQFAYITNGSSANLNTTGSRTVMAWIKLESLQDGCYIINKDGTTTGWLLYMGGGGDNPGFYIRGLTPSGLENTPAVSTGVWTHVAGVYDATNSKIKVFVNGFKTEVSVTSGSNSSNTKDTTIGALAGTNGAGTSSYFDGMIDEVVFYDRALSDREIINYYSWAKGNYTGGIM